MNAHDHLMSVDINMSLHQRHWLLEHIVAGTHEVNIENLVVPHHAEYSLVVCRCLLREELDDNPDL